MQTQLPKFIRFSESAGENEKPALYGQFQLEADCIYLQGHFPSAPILPGVAQLDWVVQLAAEHWSTPTSIQRIEVLKFNDMILPGATVDLFIERKREDCVTFKYSDGDKALSSGRLVFN
ncbi:MULTISPECIES: hydroxymyristoyl-ACP dehydratase [Idiomarina]|jgi:3-hydroxymyristoyl/3-hydroxydecanoyl-(acyl carrier protein) dehydratase|uniref:ApeI family dehydratase n=1 Tax=Idiomarina TaxID=135575 RepID=UPI000C450523|nr:MULTISPECIES: hydroxymyristoyl-ACP dehydratase [Idiomarina]MAO68943.1 hydroxymyristoyl-ACP dehydratase [Idiomarina sp.]MBF81008.1 hydroxymyristoyl-ACP dehydratase [Idiomarina sp.]RDX34725.1 hydroxymyristoyl-ACP dehydratase [Idiomarina sp. HD9-110m-PIT-SAG05]|tara:strand:- start:91 stop:447 length:357 start_codon:yes stop_codon:yes gene_type:complete